MPKVADLLPVRTEWSGSRQWKIDLPASLSPTGKRQRFFFETKQDATNFSDAQRTKRDNFGTKGVTGLSPSQLEQAARAFDAIEPYGVSLNEVVKDWVVRRKDRDKTVTFAIGYDEYLESLKTKKVKGRPVSEEYKKKIHQCFNRFPDLHPLHLTEIEPKKVAACTKGMPATSKNGFLRILSAFFSWAAQTPREWLKSNPAAKVPRESVAKGEIEIYTPDEVKRILAVAPDDLQPLFNFGFFAGIRPMELTRMQWSYYDREEACIILPATPTKTASRRVITVEPNLAEWAINYFSKHGIQRGPVVSRTNLRKRLEAVFKVAAVETIQDGLRHSYASYWLALHKDEHRLRENLGHKSADELWESYHKATTEKEAKKFWAIGMKTSLASVLTPSWGHPREKTA